MMNKFAGLLKKKVKTNEKEMMTYGRATTVTSEKNY